MHCRNEMSPTMSLDKSSHIGSQPCRGCGRSLESTDSLSLMGCIAVFSASKQVHCFEETGRTSFESEFLFVAHWSVEATVSRT